MIINREKSFCSTKNVKLSQKMIIKTNFLFFAENLLNYEYFNNIIELDNISFSEIIYGIKEVN